MSEPLFDELTEYYEAMIDWPKRLAHEEPFFRRLFERIGAGAVLDVACGTGRHAAMFHGWGLRVEGADISPAMVERARARFPENAGLRWVVRGFDRPVDRPGAFDAVVCVGNSLALAPDRAAVAGAMARMFEAVRPGGAVVVHLLNVWRLADGPCVWQKCRRAAVADGDVLIVKGVHRCGRRAYVELVVVGPDDGEMLRCDSVPLVGLESEELKEMAGGADASDVEFFGDYAGAVYDRSKSVDLIMVATKGAGT